MTQLDERGLELSATGAIGVVRRIDVLGRVVLPSEMRKTLGIREGDLLETRLDHGRVVIFKVERECALCCGRDDLIDLHGKLVCNQCVSGLVEKARGADPTVGSSARAR